MKESHFGIYFHVSPFSKDDFKTLGKIEIPRRWNYVFTAGKKEDLVSSILVKSKKVDAVDRNLVSTHSFDDMFTSKVHPVPKSKLNGNLSKIGYIVFSVSNEGGSRIASYESFGPTADLEQPVHKLAERIGKHLEVSVLEHMKSNGITHVILGDKIGGFFRRAREAYLRRIGVKQGEQIEIDKLIHLLNRGLLNVM